MEVVERKRSRGGFLNLFDWPGRSQKKKLFSSRSSSELSEEPKQTKQNEVDEIGKTWNYNSRSESSCSASSVTSDDGHGTRAPSVVARLMGLESLPVPNLQEPRFNPPLDPFLFRHSRNTNAYESLGYVNLRSDYDGVSWEQLDSRPIERFQSETFPPRLAKPISVASNRLLSPIRSPGFVPSRNLVYVMEAASRMIEPSPRTRMVSTRTRFSPSDSPSSVPMRIRDLREKLKAAQKVSCRQVSNEKRASTSVMTPSTMGKNSSEGLTSKVKKPPYVSAQGKASTTPLSVHKEKAEPKKRIVKSQNGLRGPPMSVFKQKEQRQNCRDNQRLVTPVSTQRSSKGVNKVVKKVSEESGSGKNTSLSLSRKKTLPRSKKPSNGMQESGISNDKRIKKGENVIKCNITIDGGLNSGKDDRRKEVDVISFTFSSPVKGLSSDSLSSPQVTDQDTVGAGSLNVLLEQKLRELSSKLESSSCSLTQENSSPSSANDESHLAQDESELSESVITLTCSEDEERLDWEVEYISIILGSDQLMVKEFALGMATDILPASLFNDLEARGEVTAAKLKRKTLFDFVNNCLALKCEQMFTGSCRGLLWKEGFLFEHRDWLAEELKREIQGLKKMREMMMDELVDKEMSSLEGSWLDFERETYEEGIDIEGEIVSTLVDDLVNELVSVFKEER